MRRAKLRTRGGVLLWGALMVAPLLLLSAPADAQTPLSELQFFAIHNAYQRSDPDEQVWNGSTNILSMADQLDGYNAWHMEWDLFVYQANWPYLGLSPVPLSRELWELWIGHTVLDGRGAFSFDFYLSEIAQTRRLQDGFFVIKLQMSDNLDLALYPVPPNPVSTMVYRGSAPDRVYPTTAESRIRDQILQHVPLASVYTQADFEEDGLVWPTPAELVRDGKHVAFYLSRRDTETAENLPFFLTQGGRSSGPNGEPPVPDSAMWNLGSDDIPGDPRVAMYNTPSDDEDVLAEWQEAMGNGHNFVGTTVPGERRNDPRLHPPLPTYVDLTLTSGLSCLPVAICGRGTWLDQHRQPFGGSEVRALERAIDDVAAWELATGKRSLVPIRISGTTATSTLVLSSSTEDYVIDTAIELQNDTGVDLVLD